MASKSKVYFFFDNVSISLKNRVQLKRSIESIFKKEGEKLASLNYIFCSDEVLLGINQEYLKHNYYTDILTFDLSQDKDQAMGEIYISIDRVRDNAKKLNVPVSQELLRVIYHGALHLCGYQDKTDKQKAEMRKMENLFIKKYKD